MLMRLKVIFVNGLKITILLSDKLNQNLLNKKRLKFQSLFIVYSAKRTLSINSLPVCIYNSGIRVEVIDILLSGLMLFTKFEIVV